MKIILEGNLSDIRYEERNIEFDICEEKTKISIGHHYVQISKKDLYNLANIINSIKEDENGVNN